MIVIPKPGLQIADPDQHDYLPVEGRVVADTEYWRRRLLDGDVTPADPGYVPVRPVFQPTVRGTTAQRPDPAEQGDTRFNTDLDSLEVYRGPDAGWQVLAGLGEDVIASVLTARQQALDAKQAAEAAAAQATATTAGVSVALQQIVDQFQTQTASLQAQITALQAGGGTPSVPGAPSVPAPLGVTPPVIAA